jgi:hypothetical protein
VNTAGIEHDIEQERGKQSATDHLVTDLPEDLVAATKVLQQRQRAWETQFQRFDKLLQSPPFREYLKERSLVVKEAVPALPKDVQAEQAALGAMLMASVLGDKEAVATGLRRLRPRMLAMQLRHTPILAALAAVYKLKRQDKVAEVDVIAVTTQLRRMKALGTEGASVTASYVMHLVEMCPGTANINAYIDAVIETARLRSLYDLGQRLQDAVLEPNASPERLLNIVRNAVDAIEQKGAPDLESIFANDK